MLAKVTLTNLVIDRLETNLSTGFSFALDHGAVLDAMVLEGPGRALQVSAGLVRMQWGAFEVRVTAYGIGPISQASQLQAAMDRALASGLIGHVSTLWNGSQVLDVSMAANGMTVTSGVQSLTLMGAPPTSFAALRAWQELGLRADDLDTMTATQRNAWLTELAAQGVTGLGLRDAGRLVFAYNLTEAGAALQMGDLRLSLTGAVSGFADLAGRMARAVEGFAATGRLDLAEFAGLDLTGLRLADGTGATLLRITEWQGSGSGVWVGARHYAEWQGQKGALDQVLTGAAGEVASLLTGFGGDDRLFGQGGNDALYGGSGMDLLNGGTGNDMLYGGAGEDTAVFTGPVAVRVDLRLTTAQATGHGTDLLVGIENVTGALGADWLRGNTGANRLAGLQGNDTIDGGAGDDLIFGGLGSDRLYGGLGNDSLEGGSNADTLTGGAGADVFVFAGSGGLALGMDVITDFGAGDRLALVSGAQPTAWTGLSAAEVVAQFGQISGGHAVLLFAPGQGLVLQGVASLTGLADALIL